MAGAVFVARGLTKVYRMGTVEVHALRGADLDLFPGEFVVLLGPSGSGKSTLLNILGGLDTPTAGTVRYLDHDLTAVGDAALTRFRRDPRAEARRRDRRRAERPVAAAPGGRRRPVPGVRVRHPARRDVPGRPAVRRPVGGVLRTRPGLRPGGAFNDIALSLGPGACVVARSFRLDDLATTLRHLARPTTGVLPA